MQSKSDEELLGIWTENDRGYWSPDAFHAIEAVLRERGLTIPQQKEYVAKPEALPQESFIILEILIFITRTTDGYRLST